MNGKELQVAIVRADLTPASLAEKIGMTRQCLSNKMTGKRDFKLSEIRKIVEALNLSPASIDVIFFSDAVN